MGTEHPVLPRIIGRPQPCETFRVKRLPLRAFTSESAPATIQTPEYYASVYHIVQVSADPERGQQACAIVLWPWHKDGFRKVWWASGPSPAFPTPKVILTTGRPGVSNTLGRGPRRFEPPGRPVVDRPLGVRSGTLDRRGHTNLFVDTPQVASTEKVTFREKVESAS